MFESMRVYVHSMRVCVRCLPQWMMMMLMTLAIMMMMMTHTDSKGLGLGVHMDTQSWRSIT